MTPRTRTAVVFAVIASAIVTGFTVSRVCDDRLRREGIAKAQRLKDDIDHYFPSGTPRRQFEEWSEKWSGWNSRGADAEWISVGQVPSHVWYCGPWEVGVVVSFEHDRVSATRVERWGLNCP